MKTRLPLMLMLLSFGVATASAQIHLPPRVDFDGDDKTDFVVWQPSSGTWHIIPSSRPTQPYSVQWGLPGDIPLAGDFDGDGRDDLYICQPAGLPNRLYRNRGDWREHRAP